MFWLALVIISLVAVRLIRGNRRLADAGQRLTIGRADDEDFIGIGFAGVVHGERVVE
jgi:hypothetical protein